MTINDQQTLFRGLSVNSPERTLHGDSAKQAKDKTQPDVTKKEEEKAAQVDKEKSFFSLEQEDKVEIEHLKKRDTEVKNHEQSHIAASGGYAKGGATYSYQIGPDGKKYAVGGEVSIDSSPVSGNPGATIRKAQVVRKAALAPSNPSAQDRKVAASASQVESRARVEMSEEESEEESKTKTPEAKSTEESNVKTEMSQTESVKMKREEAQKVYARQSLDLFA